MSIVIYILAIATQLQYYPSLYRLFYHPMAAPYVETLPQSDSQNSGLPETTPLPILKTNDLELITGRSNPELARKVAELLRLKADEAITAFWNGEVKPKIANNLNRKHAVIIQSTSPPDVNTYYVELFLMIDAIRRASAEEITAVIPYFGYSLQDRKDEPRVSISASTMAYLLQSLGVKRIITIDIHAEQSQGYGQIPWDNLYSDIALAPAIREDKEIDLKKLTLVAPDIGAFKRTTRHAKALGGTPIAGIYKERDVKPNSTSDALFLIGDVKGQDVLITDDILNTGGTQAGAARLVKECGANRVFAAVTHGIFCRDALKTIENSPIEKVFITDSICQSEEVRNHPKIQIVSVAPMLAQVIYLTHTGKGLTELFGK